MSRLLVLMTALTAANAAAQDHGDLQPRKAGSPVVQDGLVGTWRLFDVETQTFEPTGSADIEITPETFSMGSTRVLPNSDEDTWVFISDGVIGENTDLFYLPFCYFTYVESEDYLIIADTPSPTVGTPGAAVFRRM